MEKETKIKQLTERLAGYNKIITRLNTLIVALSDYDKKTINKTFFDKYFIDKDGRKDWKGRIYTDFHFTDKAYEWQKYAKRIYLDKSEYLEVDDTTKQTVLKQALEKSASVYAWIESAKKELENTQNTDEEQLIKDLQAVYFKHNKPSLWGDILNHYEVKYPDNE